MDGYQTIAQLVTASYTEKKSEFIAQILPVQTNNEAVAFLETVRRENRKARHHVYAYRLRHDNITRYSDDGEPQGTAGVPVLDVLQKQGLVDVCCVVTRYFGGVLLGASGLVRAYSAAAALAVKQAQIQTMLPCYPVSLQIDYSLYGKILYALPTEWHTQMQTDFLEDVHMHFLLRASHRDALQKKLIELTGNRITLQIGDLQFADFSNAEF